MNDEQQNQTQRRPLLLQLDSLTDNELLVLFVDRDCEPAFDELVSRHSQMVLGICRAVVSNQSCVDDAFQATFLAVVRNARRLRNASSFAGWLCRVARNAAIKASKAHRSREDNRDHIEPSIEIDPLSQLAAREIVQSLAQELRSIPNRYSEALTLFYFESLSRTEIADRMNCSETAVKALLQRGKQLLRARLMRIGIVPAMVVVSIQSMAKTSEAASTQLLISKTTSVCVAHFAATTPAPFNLVSLSKSGEWSILTFNSMASKAVLVACATVAATVLPILMPADGMLAQAEHAIVFEQSISQPTSNSNSIKIVPRPQSDIVEDSALAKNEPLQNPEQVDNDTSHSKTLRPAYKLPIADLAPTATKSSPANREMVALRTDHRIDTRVDSIISSGAETQWH